MGDAPYENDKEVDII